MYHLLLSCLNTSLRLVISTWKTIFLCKWNCLLVHNLSFTCWKSRRRINLIKWWLLIWIANNWRLLLFLITFHHKSRFCKGFWLFLLRRTIRSLNLSFLLLETCLESWFYLFLHCHYYYYYFILNLFLKALFTWTCCSSNSFELLAGLRFSSANSKWFSCRNWLLLI
jgi:hypothetical protein